MVMKSSHRKRGLIVLAVFAVVSAFWSCEKYSYNPPTVDPNTTWRFQADIQSIFTGSNCTDCHNGTVPPDLRDGRSYQSLAAGGYVNQPGETSKLYLKLINDPGHKPRASEADKLKIRYWIDQGAKNN